MKLKTSIQKKYKIFSGSVKDLMLRVEDYLEENQDDMDFLRDMAHSKDHFMHNAAVKGIAKRIDPDLNANWLYDYIKKQ